MMTMTTMMMLTVTMMMMNMIMMMMVNTKVCEVGTGVYEGVEDDEVAGQSVD